MDAKLNHSDFSALFSKHLNISASKAEYFTKAFFDILIEGLESDGIVKINGLGTFKMIDVASRGSVNVNTGEKIEIKGHRKLTFIPADALKDKINQPFAMFEPVEVDDDYVDDSDEPQPVAPIVEDALPGEKTTEPQPVAPIVEDALPDEKTTELQHVEPVTAEHSSDEHTTEPQTVETTKSNKGNIIFSTLFIINMIVTISIIIVIVIIFYSQFNGNEKIDENNNIVPELIAKDTIEKTVLPDTVDKQPKVVEEFVIVEAMNKLTLAQITINDTTIYSAKGTKAVHRVGLDETLTKISLQHYGDKRFWPYIVQYNGIKNYNSLEIGTELLIPHLVPRKQQ